MRLQFTWLGHVGMLAFVSLAENTSHSAEDGNDDVPVIRKDDLQNHNKEGGLWIVIHGRVYNAEQFKSDVSSNVDIMSNVLFGNELFDLCVGSMWEGKFGEVLW